MDNIFPRILSFVLLCHLVIGFLPDPNLKSCLRDFSKSISISYFSENYFKQVNRTEDDFDDNNQQDDYEEFEKRPLSICTCRSNHDPVYFNTPYLNPQNEIEEMYAYCYGEDYMPAELFDEDEILDSLLLQQIESMSVTALDPLPHDFNQNDNASCYDFYGNPTMQILGQTACLISVNVSSTSQVSINDSSLVKDYLYSGPLLARELIDFENDSDVLDYCSTTLKNTTIGSELQADSCFYKNSFESSSLICCCNKSSESFKPKEKLLCFPGYLETGKNSSSGNISALNYFTDKYSNIACSIHMRPTSGRELFSIDYGAINNCNNNERVYLKDQDNFCSSALKIPQVKSVRKCCIDGHFCNQKLIPRTDPISLINCAYKPPILVYLTGTCDLFYDIAAGKRRIIYEGFNGIIAENSRTSVKEITNNGSYYDCSTVYIKITRTESALCENQMVADKYKTFLHCTCSTGNCDNVVFKNITLSKINECHTLNETGFKHGSNGSELHVEYISRNDKWICYVEIMINGSSDNIIAGHLPININNSKCLEEDIINEYTCCVNVANQLQNKTNCTIEKMIEAHGDPNHPFSKSKSFGTPNSNSETNKNSSSQRHIEKPVHCQIENIPTVYDNNMGCPANDGCFGTRGLMKSQNDILPSGCLGDAEDYINDNITSSSSTLACRVIPNFNKCSVVYSVDGKQNVVCCCESLDENNACKTHMEKVPEKIGRMVSSFRTPKPSPS